MNELKINHTNDAIDRLPIVPGSWIYLHESYSEFWTIICFLRSFIKNNDDTITGANQASGSNRMLQMRVFKATGSEFTISISQ